MVSGPTARVYVLPGLTKVQTTLAIVIEGSDTFRPTCRKVWFE